MSFISYNNYLLEQESKKNYLQYLYNLPLEKRKEVVDFLLNINVNESFYTDIKDKIKYWINKQVFTWLINSTEHEILQRIHELNTLDPTTIEDLKKTPKVIYLGGGIDKTPDTYKILNEENYTKIISIITEFFKKVSQETNTSSMLLKANLTDLTFEVKRRTDLSFLEAEDLLDDIELVSGGGSWRSNIENYVGLNHVLRGEGIYDLTNMGKLKISTINKYPLIINPLRNEGNKRKDPLWVNLYRKWKSNEDLSKKDRIIFQKKIQKNIVTPDLRMLNACDTNLVKLDGSEGSGTQQEMGMSTFRWMNIFIWLDNGYNFSDISPWLFPSISKLLRSEEEVFTLLDTIKKEYE